jgi:hypothetical protein
VDLVQEAQDKASTRDTIDYERRPKLFWVLGSVRYLSKPCPEFSRPRRRPSHAEHQYPEKQPDILLNELRIVHEEFLLHFLLRDSWLSLLVPIIRVRCGYRDATGVYRVRLVRVWCENRSHDAIRCPVCAVPGQGSGCKHKASDGSQGGYWARPKSTHSTESSRSRIDSHGLVTGGGPAAYPALKAKEDSGWPPYSIKLGNKYYSFNKAEPLGSLLAGAADVAHSQLKDEDTIAASKTSQFISHTARNLSAVPFLMNLSEIAEGISHAGDGKTAERILDNLAASMVVPSLAKNVAQTADNTVRDPQREGITNPLPGLVQTIEERTPGLTKNVPPEINLQGQPRTRLASGLGGANPFPVSVEKPNFDVLNEMSRLGLAGAKVPLKPINVEVDGKSVPAKNSTPTADQAAAIEAMENKRLYDVMAAHIASPAWKNDEITDPEKKSIIKQVQRILAGQGMVRLGRLRQLQGQEAPVNQAQTAARVSQ